ncbi:autotransporter domain-containing protein [Bradyrhizobium sp. WSM 1704]|nr:autotransporter domain-containing protein [Bradyrhizobium semiaridum]
MLDLSTTVANTSVGNTITGNGSVSKSGAGTVTLSGVNTYSGGTSINAGTLEVAHATAQNVDALGSGAVSFNGGTLVNATGFNSVLTNSVQLNAPGGTVKDGGTGFILTGNITGAGGLTVAATQFVSLGGNNDYFGATQVTSGTLYAISNTGLSANSAFRVASGATLNLDTSAATIGSLADAMPGSGGTVTASRNATLTTGQDGSSTTFSGQITQSPIAELALTKVGAGTLTLAGANNYTGATHVVAGTLMAGAAGTFSRFSATAVDAGGTLNLGGFAQTINNVALTGGTLGNGTLAGAVTSGGGFIVDVSGSMSLSANGGTTLLSGTNGYTGATTVNNGATLRAANANAFSAASATTVNGGGMLDLGGFNQAIGSLAGSGNIGLGNAILTVGGNNTSTTYSGVMFGTGGFAKGGTGTMTLSGANTYTGVSSVTAGTLIIAAGGGITSNILVSPGAELDNSGSIAGSAGTLAAGNVANSGTFRNSSGGIVSGILQNSGSATNNGVLNGAVFNGLRAIMTTSGTVAGGLINDSGTYTQTAGSTSGGTTNSGTINANGGAFNGAVNNNGGAFVVGGAVTSDNTFTNSAATSLLHVLNGAIYTVTGQLANSGTRAGGGGIVVDAGGFLNAGGGLLNRAGAVIVNNGRIDDALDNAGNVTNNLIYNADVSSNHGAGVIFNAAGATWTGNVLDNGATIRNAGTWTGSITNAGAFANDAGATVSGLITSSGGTVVNDGAFNGGAVINGGVLTGTGSIAGLAVNGGTFAPGNGTPGASTTVTGNLVFQSAAQYLVMLNPVASSLTNVTGTATLGGAAVTAAFAPGSYVEKRYTIVSAGSVIGTFSSLVNTNLPSGFTPSLSYDASNAYLNLTLSFTPPCFGSGLNLNQQAVANTLVNFFNSTGGIPMVYGTLTPAGLTEASGEGATAAQQTTFKAMDLFLGLITDPFVAGRGDPVGAGSNPSAFTDEDVLAYAARGGSRSERDARAAMYRKAPSLAPSFDQRWSVWAAGYGGSQQTGGNTVAGSTNTTSSIYGTAVGADYRLSPRTLAGFAIAGGGTNFSVNNLGGGRSDLFQAGAFIRHNVGATYLSGALAYGWQDITTDRTVTVAGPDRLRAEFKANAWSGRLEGGYRFAAPWIGLTPYAAAQFTTFDLPSYAETVISGGGAFALGYAARSVTDSRSELGLRTDKSFAMPDAILTLRGRAAWAHDFNPDRNIAATFQALPGASFVVNGAAQASDSALVTGAAEMKWLNGWAAAATFEGEFSNVTRSYAGKGVVRYAW